MFIDVSMAFDTVADSRLLPKVSHLNIDIEIINCIASFLDNGEQSLSINGISRRPTPGKYGVPESVSWYPHYLSFT